MKKEDLKSPSELSIYFRSVSSEAVSSTADFLEIVDSEPAESEPPAAPQDDTEPDNVSSEAPESASPTQGIVYIRLCCAALFSLIDCQGESDEPSASERQPSPTRYHSMF